MAGDLTDKFEKENIMNGIRTVQDIMPLRKAMNYYGAYDKDLCVCSYPEWQEKRPNTVFYADFSIADFYGTQAIVDTYNRSYECYNKNVKMFTELIMVLNHKLFAWQSYLINEYVDLYANLYNNAYEYAIKSFKGEDLTYLDYVLD